MSTTLINIDPVVNHRKFYTVTLNGNEVTFHWGRIGTRGQTKTERFASNLEARRAAHSKLWSKIDRGYERVGAAGF